MKVVISLGGSLLTRDLSTENFRKYADVLQDLHKEGHKLIIVCGGGKTCRDYQNIARPFAQKEQLDFIGIMSTHLNASTFQAFLPNSQLVRWKPLKEAVKEVKEHFGNRIVIGAGYDVNVSTDYDSALFAKEVGADLLINATNVDGVYDKDPNKHKGAKKLPKLTHDQFLQIIMQNEQRPGEYRLFDLEATKLIAKHRIMTLMINGRDPEAIRKAVLREPVGTEIA